MATEEQQKTIQEILETRRQLEELIGSPVGAIKTDFTPNDEEYEKAYAKMCDDDRKIYEWMKKNRPLSLVISTLIALIGIGIIVLKSVLNVDDDAYLGFAVVLIFLGILGSIIFSPKIYHKFFIEGKLSKEEYFDLFILQQAKKWLEETKKNNYYLELQEKALIEKYGSKGIKGPTWKLIIGDAEITVLRRTERQPVYSCITFQIEKITGIFIKTHVNETSKSVNTENKWYNDTIGYRTGKQFTTETSVTQSTEYAVSLTFSNRINPYSIHIGQDSNLLLSVVNLLERLTGLQANNI